MKAVVLGAGRTLHEKAEPRVAPPRCRRPLERSRASPKLSRRPLLDLANRTEVMDDIEPCSNCRIKQVAVYELSTCLLWFFS
jgi:hypothetical protein